MHPKKTQTGCKRDSHGNSFPHPHTNTHREDILVTMETLHLLTQVTSQVLHHDPNRGPNNHLKSAEGGEATGGQDGRIDKTGGDDGDDE